MQSEHANALCSFTAHVDDLFPFFLRHAKQIFPVLECKEDLRKISDLRIPPNWLVLVLTDTGFPHLGKLMLMLLFYNKLKSLHFVFPESKIKSQRN